MVGTQLTSELIQDGATLLQGLDEAGVPPDAAFWFYFSDINAWKLLLAEVDVATEGPREVYRSIQKTLQTLRDRITGLTLDDISVAKPDAPLIKLLSLALTTGPGMSGIRFTGNVINGTLVDDAYIYRLTSPTT